MSNVARYRFHEFFAGSGLVSLGLSSIFKACWANDISSRARFRRISCRLIQTITSPAMKAKSRDSGEEISRTYLKSTELLGLYPEKVEERAGVAWA